MKAAVILFAFSCALFATHVTRVSSDMQAKCSCISYREEKNSTMKCEDTALQRVIRWNDFDFVNQLLKEGYDEYAMFLCVKEDNLHLTQILIDNKANITRLSKDGESYIHLAARHSSTSVMNVLLKNGLPADTVSLNDETPLTIAAQMDSYDVTQTLLHYKPDMKRLTQRGQTYCSIALKYRALQSLRALVKHCISVDERDSHGLNAIYYAVKKDDINTTSVLAEHGADLLQVYTPLRLTLLHTAADAGSTRVTRWLVHQGIDVNVLTGMAWTPLHYAAREGHLDELKLLLELGACINCKISISGWTALHFAARHGRLAQVKLLVEHGACINCRASVLEGTPLTLAIDNDHSEVAEYLKSKGGVHPSYPDPHPFLI